MTILCPPLFPKPQTVCNVACLFIPMFPLRRGIGRMEIGGRVLNVHTMPLLAVPAANNSLRRASKLLRLLSTLLPWWRSYREVSSHDLFWTDLEGDLWFPCLPWLKSLFQCETYRCGLREEHPWGGTFKSWPWESHVRVINSQPWAWVSTSRWQISAWSWPRPSTWGESKIARWGSSSALERLLPGKLTIIPN